MLLLSQSFNPALSPLPQYLRRSATTISPRFPRPGGTTGGQTIGTNGTSTTYLPMRSDVEAVAWGADAALWSYVSFAPDWASMTDAQFVGLFSTAGIAIQAAINTRSVSPSVGPFLKDAAGNDWKANTAAPRPALSSGTQSPLNGRITPAIDAMRAGDVAGTQTPKISQATSQMAAGCFGLHMDDPDGPPAFCHTTAPLAQWDTIGQGGDFSDPARAMFTVWLGANTTTAQRAGIGLPADLAGFDVLAWLVANKPALMIGAGQANPAAVDNHLFRVGVSSDPSVRELMRLYSNALRADHLTYLDNLRSAIGPVPMSCNMYNAQPEQFDTWFARLTPQRWDFACAETEAPYWDELQSGAVGSDAFFDDRAVQMTRQWFNARVVDMSGLRAFFEHKPTALNTAPATVVKSLYRSSMLQMVAAGHSSMAPCDVYMDASDGNYSQGVGGPYRFWGSVADYGDVLAFVKQHGALIDTYEKIALVHVAVQCDTWPGGDGGPRAKNRRLIQRLAELWRRDVDYHLLPVGAADGQFPVELNRPVELSAPLVIRVQDDTDFYTALGRLSASPCRRWSTAAADEAVSFSPVRSFSPYVRASARYDATARRVSVHLQNHAVNNDGTPKPMTTQVRWNPAFGTPGVASVVRLGEAPGTVDLSRGFGQVTLREYAILNFAVA